MNRNRADAVLAAAHKRIDLAHRDPPDMPAIFTYELARSMGRELRTLADVEPDSARAAEMRTLADELETRWPMPQTEASVAHDSGTVVGSNA